MLDNMDTEAFVRSTTTSAKQSVLAAWTVCGRLQAHLLFQFMLMQKQGKNLNIEWNIKWEGVVWIDIVYSQMVTSLFSS